MSRRLGREELKSRLRAASPGVLPSLLACDFAHLEREVRAVEAAGVPALHLDVMDGHFVPNLSIGVPIVEAVRRITDLPLDVHLMISEPARYVEPFRKAGADSLTIHIEAVADPRPVLDRIKSLGALAGLALNPPTRVSAVAASLPYCDLVLVMSVMPGFGGQKFDEVALSKLRELAAQRNHEPLLEVDGGIGVETIGKCAEAGAEMFVSGTAIFRSGDYRGAIQRLRSEALSVTEAHSSPPSPDGRGF
jgi:ribulose-phosphate 3-epimerase